MSVRDASPGAGNLPDRQPSRLTTDHITPPIFEALEPRLLLSGAPSIDYIDMSHDGFRFIADDYIPDVVEAYEAGVSGDVSYVEFTVGGMAHTDSSPADGWSASFNMSQATTGDGLAVTAYGPGGTDSDSLAVEILLLPDWMTSNDTAFSATHSWGSGYTFDVTTTHFEEGFYTPDDWVWYVPVVDVPLMDLSGLFTGFQVYSDFTLESVPSGDVLTSDYEFAFDAFVLDEQVVNRRFSLNTAGTVPYNWTHGFVSVSGSVAYDAHVDPFFDNNLLLAGVSGTLTAGMDLTIDMPLGSVRIPLLSVPGIADLVFDASASANFDWNASLTPTLSGGGFGLSHLSTGVDASFGITGSGSLDVGLGLGTAGASLTGTLSQGLDAEYWASSGWTSLSAPGSFDLSGQAFYSTLWGFGPSDSFDLFTWEVASWDFLEDTGSTPDSASSREGEYFVPEIYEQDIDVTVSASGAPFQRGEPILVSGTAYYDDVPLAVGTAILQFGGNTWTAPVTSGAYSTYIELPQSATDGTLNVQVVDGSDVRVQSGSREGTTSMFLDLEEVSESPFCNLEVTTAGGYWVEDVPGGNVIHPVDVREWYSPMESGGLYSILEIEDMTDYLKPKVEVYDPDGDLRWTYDAVSASGYTGPGSWAWWWYGWGDIPQWSEPGVWTIEWYLRPVGGSYDKIAADTFTYRYEFTEHMTCRDVEQSEPFGPLDPTDLLSTTDDRVYTWMNLDNLSEDISVKWEWYDPTGALYDTYLADPISTVDVSGSFDPPYGYYRVWGWTGINGYGAAAKPGDWRVDVKVKNPWGSWETQYTDYFGLFEKPGVSPILNLTPSIQNPDPGEPVSLQVSATDNTWLENVTVYWDDGTQHDSSWNGLFSGSLAETVPMGSLAAGTTVEYWGTAVDTSGNMTVLPRRSFTAKPLDEGAPPGTVDMADESDTGVSSSDDLTLLDNSVADRKLSFLVADTIGGAVVTLYADGTEIGNAIATGATTTVLTDGTHDLVDGLHQITARQQEPGKLMSEESPPLTITVDTEAPAAPSSPDLRSASDTGIQDWDDVTSLTTLTFDIIHSAGSLVGDGGADPALNGEAIAFVDAAGGPNITQQLFSVEAMDTGGAPSGGSPQVIAGVPAYLWHRGCGPTVAGMVLGYWDAHGMGSLLIGSSDDMIANQQHYDDYSLPIDNASTGVLPDKSELGGAHASNCIGDFMHTSWSLEGNLYGWSWLSDVDNALLDYAAYCGYADAQSWTENWGVFTWADYSAEIDAGQPMVLLVDTEGDGDSDHFVAGIGYDSASQQYACYDTWDSSVHWYDFAGIGGGQTYGIYGVAYFVPGSTGEDVYFRVYRDGGRISSDYESGSAFTAIAQAEGIWSYTASAVDAAGNESAQSAPLSVLIDTTPPQVVGDAVVNGGEPQRSAITSLAFTFDEDVAVDVTDLTIYNDTAGAPVDVSSLTSGDLTYDGGTNTAMWDLSGIDFPDANYTGTLNAAGVSDAAGNPLDGDGDGTGGDDYTFTFFVLQSSLDGDRDVDRDDLAIFLSAFRAPDPGASDIDGDGDCDRDDLAIFLGDFDNDLEPPSAPTMGSPGTAGHAGKNVTLFAPPAPNQPHLLATSDSGISGAADLTNVTTATNEIGGSVSGSQNVLAAEPGALAYSGADAQPLDNMDKAQPNDRITGTSRPPRPPGLNASAAPLTPEDDSAEMLEPVRSPSLGFVRRARRGRATRTAGADDYLLEILTFPQLDLPLSD